ncbi:MAG: winged helix-turn-helix transcriptional regulator [Synergistaceae bacterium]|nr:winged helix-turn-helix transcriptional regulator [Synergistaceae bacterium]
MNPTQSRIMAIMRENPRASARSIAAEIGITPRNIEANISLLKKYGLVERAGSAKSGRWTVKRP